ncbi:SERINE/THREONINE PROTEIN PHOSPHATASE 2A REGULATORY SUBUNIT [Salix koriyanagi]|uniref:SERINE/THREONINE PROTEIN PHOSPHATASE 2A REGULATORY SUBUNIT n=1 Tax=Salix koriyanagi TaxID=2511006 RepID=A0A9Q0Z0V8_9ROSI|nr:SERINE/THREONINE PROTEIN PHOSPHATASE 2A REGULATORY SUBUNIT [Salix koriyanagi]
MGVLRNSPNASPIKKSTTLQNLFDLEANNSDGTMIYSPESSKQSIIESEYGEILSIVSHCCSIFTFTDPLESPSEQDVKRLKLFQLLSFMKKPKRPLPEEIIRPLVSMLSANLFRPLPPSAKRIVVCELPEDEDLFSTLSPAWPHLQVVYEILLRIVLNIDPKVLRGYVDERFLVNLLSLFQSEDRRERDSLKNVYHRIYFKFTFYREIMRKSMNDVFLHYIFDSEMHSGIGELLEIWVSIINGFTVPLREEHKLFLMRVLIPLHKARGMQVYHRQLAYCVNQFVQKEPMLGGTVVRGILKYWPATNCQKEVLFIDELEELVENIDPDHYRKVAERALYVWNNEQFVKMASSMMEEVFPVVVEGVEKNLKWHWSKSVKQLTENVKTVIEEMDPDLYDRCLKELAHRKYLAGQEDIKRKENWERLELAAANNHQFFQPQNVYMHHVSERRI